MKTMPPSKRGVREVLIFADRQGRARLAVITGLPPMHLEAYALYRKPLIHNGGRP